MSPRPAAAPFRRPLPGFGRRRLFAGSAALIATGLLAACAEEVEAPPAADAGPEHAEPTPNTTAEQFASYVTAVHDAIAAADEELDAELLAPRVVGSAAEFRTRMYENLEASEDFEDDWRALLPVPSAELMVPMTSTQAEFPRVAIALVADSAEDGVPFFVGLVQEDARSEYTTWGFAQQAVGVEMPMVPSDVVGSSPVDLEADDLRLSPKDALALYASVLSDGNGADEEDLLADNPFQTATHTSIQDERAALNEGVEYDEAASIKENFTVVEDDYLGLRTDDGGAIVLGTFTSVRRIGVKDPATVTFDASMYTELAGATEFTSEFEREFGLTVALYIPPQDSEAQIQPIGSTQYHLGAKGS